MHKMWQQNIHYSESSRMNHHEIKDFVVFYMFNLMAYDIYFYILTINYVTK